MTARDEHFSGRVVLVTGASSGIGRATALSFAEAGAAVVATGRRAESLARLAATAQAGGRTIRTVAGDLTEPRFVSHVAECAGDVDILVNCAGVLRHAPFLESDPVDWERVFDTNVLSVLRLTQVVARRMRVRGAGHIINVSSILARRVYPYTLVYAASKHAVRAVSDGLRMELQSVGIKVTEVAPGLTDTDIFREVDHPDVIKAYEQRKFPRLTPEEVARAIVFAASSGPDACPEVIAINPVGQA